MSDLEKELEELIDLDDSGDAMGDIDNLSDFVELDDLEDLAGSADFADLSELGDLSDLDVTADLDNLLDIANDSGADGGLGADIAADTADTEEALALDGLSGLDDGIATEDSDDLAFDTVEPQETGSGEDAGDAALDAMLDGLLDDLDANGSLEQSADDGGSGPAMEDAPMDGDGMDDLLDMLGTSDSGASDSQDAPVTEEQTPEDDGMDLFALSDEPGDAGEDGSEEMENLMDGIPDDLMPEDSAAEPEEQPGMLKRLFGNVITDEIAEKELADRAAAEEAALAKQEEDAKAKEEAAAAKAAKAEEKAAAKAAKEEEKALKKAAKEEAKAARKAEKEARKAEEEAEAAMEVTGKLNKVGVSIIVVLTVMFLTAEISGTNIFNYSSTMKEAKSYFNMQKYTEAYQEILGTDVKKSDQETYDKIITVMKVQRSLNAYNCYEGMKYYPDALNALLRGVQKYDQNIETARNLEIEKDMDSCREQILSILQDEFDLSESEAYDILSLTKEEYTKKVVEIGMEKQ